ncbi:serine hydrolase [Maribacter sp. ANRC-HE7]|uniref:Serine hydrolase n=1 Tax=Maribacter aquimaris TaxID=2737171 RepID=A0ABR7V8S3_9FLAO|nr:serine hydrolase [Maribacter aquimaris]MBD0780046.1 serine hydrolase [Maribacter aquimaris]
MNKFIIILIGLLIFKAHSQEGTPIPLHINTDEGLPYASLSNMGMDSTLIYTRVDSIITNGINNSAFPGAQVLVAKNGAIVFHEAFGYHTYDSIQPVSKDDIYDLASVTKVIGPLPAIMKLVDEGKLDLDVPFSNYWTDWKHRKNKKDLTLREILAHQAGLTPYIVFLSKVIKKNGSLKKRFIHNEPNSRFHNQAYEHLYVKNRFNRKMYRIIKRSKVSDEKKYKYSGLAFLIFPELIKQLTGSSYEEYLSRNFYTPLGASTLGFNPKTKHFTNKIVPTELDTIFRHSLTQGWVHDENASLLGGVSGNAGLFGTAMDLAKMMQMYQNYGTFNGHRFISEATMKAFTRIQYPENDNRRGLGFDKPLIRNDTLDLAAAYPAPEVSPESFGHSGFTGTFIWADPKNQLVFIFLSNRVNPTRENRNLYNLNIRGAVQQVFYQSIIPD